MKYYKVVKVVNNRLYSAVIYPSDGNYEVEYKVGEWIGGYNNTKLFVFKGSNFNPEHLTFAPTKVFECKVKNPIKLLYAAHPYKDFMNNFWSNYFSLVAKHKKISSIGEMGLPQNTMLVSQVMLTKDVTKEFS